MKSFLRIVCISILLAKGSSALAQFGGQGGGSFSSGSYSTDGPWWSNRSDNAATFPNRPQLPTESALNVITVNGSAEIRLLPEKLRLVIAVTKEGESAAECRNTVDASIAATTQSWKTQLGVSENDVVEDFISILPIHDVGDTISRRDVIPFKPSGYRMQKNLHVSLKDDQQAIKAIGIAFEHGNANVVTFQYWHSKLDETKKQVMAEALANAREKSKVLLSIFEVQPKPINIDETTQIFNPESLYQTYSNILLNKGPHWNQGSQTAKLSFLRGLQADMDSIAKEMLMRPEIVIASRVSLYFQSPAQIKQKTDEDQ